MSAPERLEVSVQGRVQGVGFRVFVVRRAMALGLAGWVANAATGGVDLVAEGERADLQALLDAVRLGPPAALVERVTERWAPARGGLEGFAIRSGAHRGD
jgi:acylphosphatase